MGKEEIVPCFSILQQFRDSVASEGLCPDCLKKLDSDMVCNSCGYDCYYDEIEEALQDDQQEMDDEPV